MALAHLSYAGTSAEGHRFHVRTGSNPFFIWMVGRDPTETEGVTTLHERDQVSSLLRSDPRGHAVIDVPAGAFDKPDTAVQVLSYRTETLRGPAASAVVGPVGGTTAWRPRPRRRPGPNPADQSTAMFLDGVVSAITRLMPAVSQLVPEGLNQLFGGAAQPAAPGAGGGGGLGSLLAGLVTPAAPASPAPRAAAPSAAAPPPAPAAPAATPTTTGTPDVLTDVAALITRPETRRLIDALVAQIRSLSTGSSLSIGQSAPGGPVYAEAKVLPAALLAALPALMPLLQNVLSPQTIQSVLQTADPNRLLATITAGIGDLAKIGIQADQEHMAHLERLNPGLGDDFAERLLTSMSLEARQRRGERDYRRSDRVVVDFVGLEEGSVVGDEPVIAFSGDTAWRFTLAVRSPRPIRDARLTVRVEDRMSRRPHFERTVPIDLTSPGAGTAAVDVPARVVTSLSPGSEHHVRATVTWPGRNTTWGTSRVQLVSVPRPVTVGRVHSDGELVPLDDVTAFRPFWHRVWAADFTEGMRRVELRVRYKYSFDADAREAVREPTRVEAQVAEGRWELTGSVSSGLRIGPAVLDTLVTGLTGQRLDPAVLAACAAAGSALELGGTAQGQVRLRGRPGEQAAIWVWPEVRWHRVVLHRPGTLMPTGQVHSFTEEEVRIPFPALVHVVGASS